MKCRKIKHLLPDFAGKSLEPDKNAMVKKHIAECPNCQEEIKFLKKYLKETSSLPKVTAPADFLEKIHIQIDKPAPLQQLIKKLFVPIKIKIPLEAIGVLAIAVLVILIYDPFSPDKLPYRTDSEEIAISDKVSPGEPDKNNLSGGYIADEGKQQPAIHPEKFRLKSKKRRDLFTADLDESKSDPVKSIRAKREEHKIAKEKKLSDYRDKPTAYEVTLHIKQRRGIAADDESSEDKVDKKTSALERESSTVDSSKKLFYSAKGKRAMGQSDLAIEISRPAGQIKKLAVSLDGKLVKEIYNKKTGAYITVIIELPAKNYNKFLDKLNANWNIDKQKPSALPGKIRNESRIKLNINLR